MFTGTYVVCFLIASWAYLVACFSDGQVTDMYNTAVGTRAKLDLDKK